MKYEINNFYNIDCMKALPEIPDNYFDLAIVDPPYGIGIGGVIGGKIAQSRRFTRHLMTQQYQAQTISMSWREYQNIGSYGVVIIFLTISTQQKV